MSKILILKKPDLLRNELVEVIKRKLENQNIHCCYPQNNNLQYLERVKPDLVMIDIDTVRNSFEFIESFLDKKAKVVVWTSEANKSQLSNLFTLGLHGYFVNEMETKEIIFALQSILKGHEYVHPKLSSILLNDYLKVARKRPKRPDHLLTNREWDVLELIVKGQQTCLIGQQLFISTKTVTNHVTSILRKLGVADRTGAALMAVRKGWVIL